MELHLLERGRAPSGTTCESAGLNWIGVVPPKVVEYGVEKERPGGMGRDTAVEDMVVVQRSRLQKLVKCQGGSNASWRVVVECQFGHVQAIWGAVCVGS